MEPRADFSLDINFNSPTVSNPNSASNPQLAKIDSHPRDFSTDSCAAPESSIRLVSPIKSPPSNRERWPDLPPEPHLPPEPDLPPELDLPFFTDERRFKLLTCAMLLTCVILLSRANVTCGRNGLVSGKN